MANDDELCFSSTSKFIPIFYHLSLLILSHPLYFSYFLFFSPYIFRFIFFISPLFFTTTAFFLISLVATAFPQPNKLGFLQTILDKLRSKVNGFDEDELEFCDFEDFEIYKIVFRDPPLVTVGDGDAQRVPVMVNAERSLESLFEELDRFEDSSVEIEKQVKESISGEDRKSVQSLLQQFDHSSSFRSYESTGGLTPVIESISGEDQKTVQSLLQQFDNSSSFVSYESTGGLAPVVIAKPVIEPIFGKDQKTVRSLIQQFDHSSSSGSYESTEDSTAAIDMTENETKSHLEEVAGELQKKTVSGDDQKTVNSNLTAAIEMKENEMKSDNKQVSGELQKKTVSGEDQKTVNSNLAAAIEKKSPPAKESIPVEDPKSVENSWRLDSCSSFGSYGSMRKEKEWRRTLACKLFEERNNSEGGEEGMDSLWEAYEDNNCSRKSKITKESVIAQKKKTMMMKNKKKTEFKYFDDGDNEEEDDDDDDEFRSNGQLCCLKALKLSTGKMNLGMGKPNLVKISKAIKGFGWLHHVGTKHAKKV